MKKELLKIKNRAVAWLLAGTMVLGISPLTTMSVSAEGTSSSAPLLEANTGDMNIVPYNNEDLRVEVASG